MCDPIIYTIGTLIKNNQPYLNVLNDFLLGIRTVDDYINAKSALQVVPFVLYYNNINLIYKHTKYVDDFVKFFNMAVFSRRNNENKIDYEGDNDIYRLLTMGNNKVMDLNMNFEQYALCKQNLSQTEFDLLLNFYNIVSDKFYEGGDIQ